MAAWGCRFGGTRLTPSRFSPQVAGSWAEHLPSAWQAQEGAERGHPHRAANRRSGDATRSWLRRTSPPRTSPHPPAKGLGRAGWHFYASCVQAMPCPRVPPPGAVLMVPCPLTQGYPAPGFLPTPRNGSTNSPLCFWSCWQGGLGALPAPPLWGHCLLPVTSSWEPPTRATSWGAPTG